MQRIELVDGDSRATVAPARGGLVTSFFARGRELLYLDEATFSNVEANVRGGVPVLFPTPGKLANDAWARDGRSGRLRQHGFARNEAWDVVDRSASSLTMRLASSDGTLAVFPWAFRFDLTVRLVGASLELALAIANTGAETMPFGVGFHPYFRLDDGRKASAVVPTDAKRAFDNARKGMVSLSRIDLAREEVDLHLEGHGGGALELHDGPRHLVVRGSDAFTQWVVWTLAGRDFVCLEPWSCPGDAMNTGDRLGHLAPGATTTSSVVIDCVA